ncbi:spore maturation protein A [Gottschalkia acidurici 9a]|uniref:Spore maturation protein A n=1 Tax=Gottschalkia acidurici (strain ATCC 7906 / DSM 604 / BCRC 14475 / CIP 104303 / KCTC 5404 / NCIMB 10678 / 9a) TaxID=1128398 RepID=K0AWT9_GOTA9|nr:nucleoside recognition domain-containing protein [Gottschalkia acidurici]AFS77200.1 spore maturation protein A [Gottschalkia acidurici 9a]
MINYIWFFLILISIVVSALNGKLDVINQSIMTDAQEGVTFGISLIGIMAMWMGLIKIAEKSGLLRTIGKIITPITSFLFPNIPKNHPAMSSIVMNMVTNMFGAGNSATAIGIKAMEEMNTLNRDKRKATNDMCMFLVINMSSIQLIPITVLKLRADAGSANPTEIIGTTLIATLVSTVIGVLTAKILQRGR